MRDLHETTLKLIPNHKLAAFFLRYGRDYQIGPKTFDGPRGERGMCFRNATMLAIFDETLSYVEGHVAVCDVPIEHAWCVDADGIVVDPTITSSNVGGYFGVPLLTPYVRLAITRNGTYGILDLWSARKTLPKLIELGLENGQRWLLDGGLGARRKTIRRSRSD